MKRKQILEIKNKSAGELEKMLVEGRKKLNLLRFDLVSGKVKNVKEIKEVKKNIARLITFLKDGNDKNN
ncbi:MAG: 50S ribosomal protein L29 [Candidatus Liptonbacteria bacterium RIFOXYC1_FULL_36_8]|uniref:Large ribosomal subunit protein uL29 n=3 Tax=Candidatus Liptoniibacteriota TaxID=1817909 RepID=A0A1G2CPJ0_9BACT|nr:MAG: 50S ribosomal protein L29 [Candidatus Liptonbacteria bacterium RIFOXYB1_FULL_36_10]OGZ04128.1 MAG: 50S ribosomal protein L29 [Candidatus Liptonbacteria bacterium RIFOXYC1_FULL_36_8]OGZ04543.1 MAG: 50S ribosomal protein L29 [Candidatus Liptonbacteria bacterium RIFOXYD1_FULL_36_11]